MSLITEKFETIVSSGNFDTLIGEVEGSEFECKDQPYRTENDAGKRELAKDVSALANSRGGFIFIGVRTKQSTTHFGDEVEAIRPFSQGLVNTSQYTDVLRAWIYPEVEGVTVHWVVTIEDAAKGLVIIRVPEQKELSGPFLITKTIDGIKQVETVFGYVERKGDKNLPLKVKELQWYLRSGFHYEERIEKRLDGLEALIKKDIDLESQEAIQKGKDEQIEQRIARAAEHGNLKNGRLFVLSAQPMEQKELRTIFLNQEGSIKQYLEHPPILRQHGWSMETLDQARILRGEMIRVANGDRKVIDLYRDGTMVFVTSADHHFLAWGEEDSVKINPLALSEVVYSFITLYRLVFADFISVPEQIAFRVDFRNMHLNGTKNTLAPDSLQSWNQRFNMDAKEAPDNNWSVAKTSVIADFDVSAVAYVLIREIYLWFGLEEDKIPYVKEENGIKMLDTTSMLQSGE